MIYQSAIFLKCSEIIASSSKYSIQHNVIAKGIRNEVYEITNTFPLNVSFSKRIYAIVNQTDCKCKSCGKIHGDYTKDYCSNKCYQTVRLDSKIDKHEYELKKCIAAGEKKFKDKIEGYDYQVCEICGAKTGDLGTHIMIHDVTSAEYKLKYNVDKLKPIKHCKIRQGKNNPAYHHNGKYSAWSKNFIHGYDKERHAEHKTNHSKFMKNYDNSIFKLSYWLNIADGDEVVAKELYTKSQTRDINWFIEKYGEIDGINKHKEKIKKWSKTFKKASYSKISQELFAEIATHIDCTNVYYATFLREDMTSYKNKEYTLELANTYVRPDFIDTNLKKVIEFDGDYWHSPAKTNPARELLRDNIIKQAGYDIIHVNEYEYKNNKQQAIQQCLNFLKQ